MFDVVSVFPADVLDLEQVGSKEKFWFVRTDAEENEEEWLCKLSRRHAGEDWSEKIAAELCEHLGLPHAVYELATYDHPTEGPLRAVISKRIDTGATRLVLGDELLADHANRYEQAPQEGYFINPEYTLDLVLSTLDSSALTVQIRDDWTLPPGVRTPSDVFVGYLMLDAWIGNTDRHDQNWAVLETDGKAEARLFLAPTFDHASCLGRELRDSLRRQKLNATTPEHSIVGYIQKCYSRFVAASGSSDVLHVREVFQRAQRAAPDAATAWLDCLRTISDADLCALFEKIPDDRITTSATDFALDLLTRNRDALLQ